MCASAGARPSGQVHKTQRDLWCSAPPTPSARANSRCYMQEFLCCLEPTSCHPALQVNRALNAADFLTKTSQPICLDLTQKTALRSWCSHTSISPCLHLAAMEDSPVPQCRTSIFLQFTLAEQALTWLLRQFFTAPVSCLSLTRTVRSFVQEKRHTGLGSSSALSMPCNFLLRKHITVGARLRSNPQK